MEVAIVLSKMTTSKLLIKHGIIEGKCSLSNTVWFTGSQICIFAVCDVGLHHYLGSTSWILH
jgi:hypothetical protein